MLHSLFQELSQHFGFLRAFEYITMRAIMSALTALLIALIAGPQVIAYLTKLRLGQQVRDDGPESHLVKAGTPTMGGVLILISVAVATLLWSDLSNRYVWVVLLVTLGNGAVGAIDDSLKLKLGNSKGLSARRKLFWQSLIALVAAGYLYVTAVSPADTELLFPALKFLILPLGLFFIPFVWLVIVGSSNAVNLTDGLDGLAILPTVLVGGALGLIAYVTGHAFFSDYLNLPHIVGVGEVSIFCASLVGSGLGFLWFNTYPAQVFMGDVGALGLGAALGVVAVVTRQELVLMIMGGIFVLEAVSVILQVASFRLTGKRVFRMAPIHHHFELKGWPEPRIIVRFWIITVILVLLGLATLKVR